MIRIKIPFQFKIYLLLFVLFGLLLHLTTSRVNTIVSTQIKTEEMRHFEGLKNVFYKILRFKLDSLKSEAQILANQLNLQESLEMLQHGELIESFLQTFLHSAARFPDSYRNGFRRQCNRRENYL